MAFDIRAFLRKSVRVWHVLRKPTREEFSMVAKVSALGILIIGAVGFAIAVLVRMVS